MVGTRGRSTPGWQDRRAVVGGKAAELEHARAAGLPVPRFLALRVDEVAALLAGGPRAADAAARLSNFVGAEGRYAVRSSAQAEDGQRSFAGQFRTALDVPARRVPDAVAEVAASLHSPEVTSYAAATGVQPGALAVVVQEMVPARWSGVAFSRDPLTYQPEVLVEAVAGPGEALVSGERTPSRAWFDRGTATSLEHVAHEPVPEEVLAGAARMALRSEEVFGCPQDVEWVHDGARLHLLQSRALTGFEQAEVYSDTWSAEVWPGLIKPLVFDVGDTAVNAAWGRILTSVAGPMDVDWRRMAGLAASRVYFNDSLLGVVLARAGLPENTLESVVRGERPRMTGASWSRLGASTGRLLRFLALNTRWLARVDAELPTLRMRIARLADGIETAEGVELAERLDPLLDVLEDAAYLSALTTLSMGLRSAYARAVGRLLRDDTDVRAAATSVEGTAPLASLGRVAEELGDLSDAQRAEVASGDPARIVAALGEQRGAAALTQMDALLSRWGHVAAVNTDFSTPAWREDPALMWRLALTARPAHAHPAAEPAHSAAASEPPGDLRRAVVARRLHVLRAFVAARDEVNDVLAQAYDAWRRCAQAAGAALSPQTLDDPALVHSLRLDEAARGRRRELQRDADVVPPHRLWDLRLPERGRLTPAIRARGGSGADLQGVPASPGRVRGRARVLSSPAQADRLAPGEVLVVDHADIGWTPLFPVAGAIVTSVGGALCHAAVVARELGIPAVVGVPDAVHRIADGQLVAVDGGDGSVAPVRAGASWGGMGETE
jgi:phosphohistidine swiveling domain-containing protein